jgi:predicted porin
MSQPSRRSHRSAMAIALTALVASAAGAAAQSTSAVTPTSADPTQIHTPGWAFTPGLIYSGSWDDNVLIQGLGAETTGDYLTVINPRGTLAYTGRHTRFDANYDGAFLLYHALDTLNSYDQHGTVSLERALSRQLSVFVRDSAARVPTTDVLEFVGVPFVRTGSSNNDLRGGVTATLSKRTAVTATYSTQWVHFEQSEAFASFLRGGYSQGGAVTVKHALTGRTSIIGDYDITTGRVNGIADEFDVQNGSAGVEHRFSERLSAYGALGLSRLALSSFGPARTGPAWRAGAARQFQRASLDASYSRAFVPSYGFGGTTQNEDATVRARVPLGRRVTSQSSVSWRRNEPLTPGDLRLKSWWIESAVGYALESWVRLEAFYNGSRQTIDRPGGVLDRNRIGFQVVMAQPMRMQ